MAGRQPAVRPAPAFGAVTVLAALLLCSCGRRPPGDAEMAAESGPARAYIASDVAEQAKAQAIEDIRQLLSSAADRALLDIYLADPMFVRAQLPRDYEIYLIVLFDTDEIAQLIAWDGDPEDFERQVKMHRFVISESLTFWHMWKEQEAGRDELGTDDPLLRAFGSVYRATPTALRPVVVGYP
jgi:hypothetical protein